MNNKTLGKYGEELAANYYTDEGYIILERNFRSGHDEIDLIVRNDKSVAFIEVKTRTGEPGVFGRPSDAVNRKKRLCLLRAAASYMRTHKSDLRHRFDVFEISVDEFDYTYTINVIKNAFDAKGYIT